jgi:rubredoxin
MSLTGSGNWWSKKDWYRKCPVCHKKGFKDIVLWTPSGTWRNSRCRFCGYSTDIEKTPHAFAKPAKKIPDIDNLYLQWKKLKKMGIV